MPSISQVTISSLVLPIVKKYFIVLTMFFLSCNDNNNAKTTMQEPLVDSTHEQPMICDMEKLIYKSPDEMHGVFGKPSSTIKDPKDCGTTLCDLEEQYKEHGITIQYYQKQSIWYSFDNTDSLLFVNLPTLFGFKNKTPDQFIKGGVVWYTSFPIVKRLVFVESKDRPGYVDYALVEGNIK